MDLYLYKRIYTWIHKFRHTQMSRPETSIHTDNKKYAQVHTSDKKIKKKSMHSYTQVSDPG